MRLPSFVLAVFFLLVPAAAWAHPHVWVDAASEIVFDDRGRIVAVRHHWLFDEAFSVYALQGLDADRDGTYSPEELEPLARENVESLTDFGFFTFLSVGSYQAGFAAPRDYYLELTDGRLLLHFTLPLAQPFKSESPILLEVFDPEYYVAFSLPNVVAVRLVDAPDACRLTVHPARELDAAAAETLATIGPDQRELPEDMKGLTAGIENSAEIACGPATPLTAGEAADVMAGAGGGAGDLTALPAAPAEQQDAQPGARPARQASDGLMARISAWQAAFNRDLTDALKALKDGGAFWWLGGISFLYGIVHAAGPGHGKVVISSYLVANEAQVSRGVAIAFVAAFAQAVVAVGLIAVMAVILNMTSMAITGTAQFFEAGSFALVALLGLYLLARKGRDVRGVLRGGDAHAHHHHHHHHHHDHGYLPPPLRGRAGEGGERHSQEERSAMAARPVPPPSQMGEGDHAKHGGGGGRTVRSQRPPPPPRSAVPLPRVAGGEPGAAAHACQHHVLPAATRPGLSGAAAAILSVGIRPCSGALVVLVFALAQGVFWAGVASTFLMALGTAITVAALAALAVGAKDIARRLSRGDGRRSAQFMLGLELAAAFFITALGVVLFAGALYA